MERGDACLTRRPLLEGATEEVEAALPALSAGAARAARRQANTEDRYALLQEDAEEEAAQHSSLEPPRALGVQPTASPLPLAAPVVPAASTETQEAAPLTEAPTAEHSRPLAQSPVQRQEDTPASSSSSSSQQPPHRGPRVETPGLVIEMQTLNPQPEGASYPAGDEPVPPEAVALPPRGRNGDDRHCFICLGDGGKDTPLVRCCSTCYACVHVRCWRDWRNNQRITALRSRLLGLRMQTSNLLRCTICKSGTAVLAGEEDGLEWMNELLCGGGDNNTGPGRLFGNMLTHREDSDEDGDAQLEDLVDMRTCFALMVYLGVLILVLLVACTLIVMQQFYAGDVVLCCIIALYELSVLQIVALAVARRRGAILGAASSSSTTSGDRSVLDLEAQRAAREVSLAVPPVP